MRNDVTLILVFLIPHLNGRRWNNMIILPYFSVFSVLILGLHEKRWRSCQFYLQRCSHFVDEVKIVGILGAYAVSLQFEK